MAKKSALGRGLGALIDDGNYEKGKTEENIPQSVLIDRIKIEDIELNPFQPRTKFDLNLIEELAGSIKELGIIQPITVRKTKENKYQLISGERRFRATKMAGLETIPAFIREADDKEMLEMSLVENIQREDLNAIEIAISYQRLIDECNITQETLSERVGKKRATITNYLRLLKLPAEIQIGLRDRQISMGHARALVNLNDPATQIKFFFKIVNEGLSVRKVEAMVREILNPQPQKKAGDVELPENVVQLRDDLRHKFDSKIDVKRTEKGDGRIVIPFKSDEDFVRIIELINKENE